MDTSSSSLGFILCYIFPFLLSLSTLTFLSGPGLLEAMEECCSVLPSRESLWRGQLPELRLQGSASHIPESHALLAVNQAQLGYLHQVISAQHGTLLVRVFALELPLAWPRLLSVVLLSEPLSPKSSLASLSQASPYTRSLKALPVFFFLSP